VLTVEPEKSRLLESGRMTLTLTRRRTHGGIRFAQWRGVGANGEHNMSYQPGTDGDLDLVFVFHHGGQIATRALDVAHAQAET